VAVVVAEPVLELVREIMVVLVVVQVLILHQVVRATRLQRVLRREIMVVQLAQLVLRLVVVAHQVLVVLEQVDRVLHQEQVEQVQLIR
jgi:hypothetical protein